MTYSGGCALWAAECVATVEKKNEAKGWPENSGIDFISQKYDTYEVDCTGIRVLGNLKRHTRAKMDLPHRSGMQAPFNLKRCLSSCFGQCSQHCRGNLFIEHWV